MHVIVICVKVSVFCIGFGAIGIDLPLVLRQRSLIVCDSINTVGNCVQRVVLSDTIVHQQGEKQNTRIQTNYLSAVMTHRAPYAT